MEKLQSDEKLVSEISSPLYHGRSWLKLIGIVGIVYGIFMAITIVGLIIAWLPIWIGVLIFQSGTKISTAYANGDKLSLIKVQKT